MAIPLIIADIMEDWNLSEDISVSARSLELELPAKDVSEER
jgi:hypothetical protein